MLRLCDPAKLRHIEFDRLKKTPLEPLEFCQKWVKGNIGDYGYRSKCIAAIAEITGLSPRTIERWGPDFSGRPDHVPLTLRKEDILNQVREQIGEPPDYLK